MNMLDLIVDIWICFFPSFKTCCRLLDLFTIFDQSTETRFSVHLKHNKRLFVIVFHVGSKQFLAEAQ